jgi:CheY-like chemotaxis protein
LVSSVFSFYLPFTNHNNAENLGSESSLDNETREYLTKSHSASKSLIYVINDLLDLTKTEEGFDLIKSEVIELHQTFDEAIDAFRGDAKRKNIEYNVTLHPGIPRKVLGDQRKVRQAISNLIANAIKNTSKGGVTIEVYVTALEGNIAYIEIAVEDTGVGMSAKKLDALFMHLEQVQTDNIASPVAIESTSTDDGGTKEEESSLGLGLAIVARIVRNMNGQLRLKSEEQQGSRFAIRFPFEIPQEELSRHDSESRKSSVRTLGPDQTQNEVLLVDPARDLSRSRTQSPNRLGRAASNESIRSRKSLTGSVGSVGSGKGEVDRLIEAIQGPHMVEGKRLSGSNLLEGYSTSRPALEKMRTLTDDPSASKRHRAKSFSEVPPEQPVLETGVPGQQNLPFSGVAIKPVKVPEDDGPKIIPGSIFNTPGAVIGEVLDESEQQKEPEPLSADNLNILVAEDDPVNSKILKKRLERSGHSVTLTINGEECATTYGDNEKLFDVVLMDMQVSL